MVRSKRVHLGVDILRQTFSEMATLLTNTRKSPREASAVCSGTRSSGGKTRYNLLIMDMENGVCYFMTKSSSMISKVTISKKNGELYNIDIHIESFM